jgi:hypothetical protein
LNDRSIGSRDGAIKGGQFAKALAKRAQHQGGGKFKPPVTGVKFPEKYSESQGNRIGRATCIQYEQRFRACDGSDISAIRARSISANPNALG